MAEERLTMRKDISSLIFRINIFMKSCRVVNIGVFEIKFDGVLLVLEHTSVCHSNSMVLELNIVLTGFFAIDRHV